METALISAFHLSADTDKITHKFLIVLDEIDRFSESNNDDFKIFLRQLLVNTSLRPTVVGIANSVNLFKDEAKHSKTTKSSGFLGSIDIEKLVLDPYTKSNLISILQKLLVQDY